MKLILIAHVRLLLPTLKQKPKRFVADGVMTAAPVNYFTFRDFFAGLRRLLLPFCKTEKVHPNSPGIALNQWNLKHMASDKILSPRPFPFPGIAATGDGSEAVVWVETQITQGACAYPITPSTNMGGGYQLAVANGQRNLWGEPLAFLELESEHSSASTCEGFALAGGRVANFTSGQGLILMKEVLYVIAGKRLPVVFHIGARALTSQALNIHAGHDDVMGVADCGWGMLFARNVQEAADLALISRRIAEESETPFFNIQDGFLTTHTIESLRLPEPELMKQFVGDPNGKHRLRNLMDPAQPIMSGVVQKSRQLHEGQNCAALFL